MSTGPGYIAGVSDGQTRMLQGVATAVSKGDNARAAEIASTALGFGMQHPTFFYARGLGAQDEGRLQDALKDFEQALLYLPRDVNLLNAVALCMARVNRIDDAIAHFDAALQVSPTSAQTHYRKGWALVTKGDHVAAWRSYERAVQIRPNFAEALAGMASIAARDGDTEKARSFAEKALKINSRDPTALVALGMVDNATGDFAAAERRLKPLLDDPGTTGHSRAVALGFFADSLNGQERFSEAFDAYVAENEEFHNINAPRFADQPRFGKKIGEWLDYFEKTDSAPWASTHPVQLQDDAPKQHVFLLGFLRSGTTLLEQILAANPGIEHLEERETFADASLTYMADSTALDRLADIGADELERARAEYWKQVRDFGAKPKGKIFLDKQPLNTFNLPLISKLFPNAKVIFALRDPRDVVFSCFRRHFEVNAMMYEFLRLPDAAQFYDIVMRMSEAYRAKLRLNILEHRYEDMVEDFEGRVKLVCDFIEAPWTEEMRNFSEAARNRQIRSPSAAQVRRPLYGEGVGQWRSYAKELAPIFPTLQPWIERYGYPAE